MADEPKDAKEPKDDPKRASKKDEAAALLAQAADALEAVQGKREKTCRLMAAEVRALVARLEAL
jgi:hypothetical protein